MSLRDCVQPLRYRFAPLRRVPLFDTMWLGAVLALVACGCETSSTSTATSGKGAAKTTSTAPTTLADARCQQLLMSGLDMMKPESLGITSQEQQVVDSLNNWASDCGKSTAPPPDDPPKKGAANTFSDLYDQTDIEHVRNCWLLKELGAGVLRSQPTDLERIVGLFDLSLQTVALLAGNDPVVPQTIYQTVVIGRGTAEDRAWLFGELLRQAGFDSVILRPKAASEGAAAPSSRWLVGVLLDKQVYLFDPTLGWAIPSPEDKGTTATVRQPATLAQVLADDKVLRKLDLSPEKKYPLHAADLKSMDVEIITSSRYSEPRIKRIESFLAGNRSTAVYAPLADTGGKPGLQSRIEAAGGGAWKKQDVSAWDYPDKQISAAHHLEGQPKDIRDALWLPFEGPVELEFDMKTMHWKISSGTTIKSLKGDKPNRAGAFPGQEENDRVEVRHDPRKEIKARIAQLQGDYAKAIRTYLSVQLDELPPHLPLPEEVQERARSLPPDQRPKGLDKNGVIVAETPKREFVMNFRAAEDAKFWMGVCQLDQHEAETAEETLGAYLRRYGQGAGTWVVQAAHLRAVALADNKKFALAVQGITQLADALPESDFRRPTYELLSARWRLVRDAAKPSADPAPQKESTASAKSDPAPAKPPASEKPPAPTQSSPAAPPATTKTPAPPAATDAKSTTKPKTP